MQQVGGMEMERGNQVEMTGLLTLGPACWRLGHSFKRPRKYWDTTLYSSDRQSNTFWNCPIGLRWSVLFSKLLFLFIFQFGKFLFIYLQGHWLFPWPWPVYWWAHQRCSSFNSIFDFLCFLWFFLRVSISMLILPIRSCMLPIFSH